MSGISGSELEAIVSKIGPIAASYKVERIYLFGSRARCDGNPGSDYDFLVVPKKDMSAFQMCGLLMDLEEAFGSVDLVSSRSISGHFERSIMNERVLVYAE